MSKASDLARLLNTDGSIAAQDGLVVDNDGATVATFDRATSDGTIVEFQKDGSAVGSVGTVVGDTYIGNSTGSGLYFGGSRVHPMNNLQVADNLIDMGHPSYRFKDFYLSGGVYLGGTGAANYLDDYEEGTWTPTLTASGYTFTHTAQYGFYTKVGNLVTVKLYMIASYSSGSGTAVGGIYGLPFQSGSSYANYGGGSWFPDTGSQFFSRTGAVRTQRNATFLRLGNGFGGSTLQSNFDWSTMPSSMEFEISAQYFTD